MDRRILLTGFEAFGGETINPSALAVAALAGKMVAGREVVSAVLPCVFDQSSAELIRYLDEVEPELVICVGQAGGRDAINLERVARNIDDAEMADNSGAQPTGRRIAIAGPATYHSSLPLESIVDALNAISIKTVVSDDAGSFVCNHVFYNLMCTLKSRPGVRGGFIHVPFLPEQVEAKSQEPLPPSMPLERIVESLRVAMEVTLL